MCAAASCTEPPSEAGGRGIEESSSAGDVKPLRVAIVRDVLLPSNVRADDGIELSLKEYCENAKIDFAVFETSEDTDAARLEAMMSAASSGADIVVCAGYYMNTAVLDIQDEFRDVSFLCVGAVVPDEDLGEELSDNVHLEVFSEADACFMAGYIAVSSGAERPAFTSAKNSEISALCFGGFADGASCAASELGIDTVTVMCGLADFFYSEEDEFGNTLSGFDVMSSRLIDEGCDVISAYGASAYPACVAADAAGVNVISVCADFDEDFGAISSCVKYDYGKSAVMALKRFCTNGGKWSVRDAGTYSVVGIAEGCIQVLRDDDAQDINQIESAVKSGEVQIVRHESFDSITPDRVEINYIND